MAVTIARPNKPELRLTENAKRALVFTPAAAAAVQHQVEMAGYGAVALRPCGGNYKLTLGRCYISYWAA